MEEGPDPEMEWKVRAKVVDKRGYCPAGHIVGDEIEVSGCIITRGRLCIWALRDLCKTLQMKRYALKEPFQEGDKVVVHCPDWENGVWFEVSLGEKVPRARNIEDAAAELRKWKQRKEQ